MKNSVHSRAVSYVTMMPLLARSLQITNRFDDAFDGTAVLLNGVVVVVDLGITMEVVRPVLRSSTAAL
jgi:hypothetical protein